MASAKLALVAVEIDLKHIRIFARHPRRMRSRACRETDADPVRMKLVHHFIEPAEIVGFLIRLVFRPCEYVQSRHVDASQLEHT
ncbi:hypothetical protein D3C80_1824340 [compost metagenome]